MNTTQTTQNPIARVSSWYKGQVTKNAAEELAKNKEKYELEMTRFNDAFESVSKLDGSSFDGAEAPGEVKVKSEYQHVMGKKSLTKTDEGFALVVGTSPLGGVIGASAVLSNPASPFALVGSKTRAETTEYQMNSNTGTISVTREATRGLFGGTTESKESFILDTNTGLVRDQQKTAGETKPLFPLSGVSQPWGVF